MVLRFFEDLPEADIARILERPLGTVKSELYGRSSACVNLLEEVSER